MRVVLASTSPRRSELLRLLRIPFQVSAPSVKEVLTTGRSAEEHAMQFARDKAVSCTDAFPDAWVLGSDTLIALDEDLLGKPLDVDDAMQMVSRLAGREHVIHTAVALVCRASNAEDIGVVQVRVWMRALSHDEIIAYVRTGESLGKAGGYAIQGKGGNLIERIAGDFTAAVGLPLRLVASLLANRGVTPPINIDALYREKPYPNWRRFAS